MATVTSITPEASDGFSSRVAKGLLSPDGSPSNHPFLLDPAKEMDDHVEDQTGSPARVRRAQLSHYPSALFGATMLILGFGHIQEQLTILVVMAHLLGPPTVILPPLIQSQYNLLARRIIMLEHTGAPVNHFFIEPREAALVLFDESKGVSVTERMASIIPMLEILRDSVQQRCPGPELIVRLACAVWITVLLFRGVTRSNMSLHCTFMKRNKFAAIEYMGALTTPYRSVWWTGVCCTWLWFVIPSEDQAVLNFSQASLSLILQLTDLVFDNNLSKVIENWPIAPALAIAWVGSTPVEPKPQGQKGSKKKPSTPAPVSEATDAKLGKQTVSEGGKAATEEWSSDSLDQGEKVDPKSKKIDPPTKVNQRGKRIDPTPASKDEMQVEGTSAKVPKPRASRSDGGVSVVVPPPDRIPQFPPDVTDSSDSSSSASSSSEGESDLVINPNSVSSQQISAVASMIKAALPASDHVCRSWLAYSLCLMGIESLGAVSRRPESTLRKDVLRVLKSIFDWPPELLPGPILNRTTATTSDYVALRAPPSRH